MINRLAKINELLKQQISWKLHKELGQEIGISIINAVYTSKDLQHADIYVSILTQDNCQKSLKLIQNKAYQWQKELKKNLSTKFIPNLNFILDESQNKIDKIDELLNQINQEKDKDKIKIR